VPNIEEINSSQVNLTRSKQSSQYKQDTKEEQWDANDCSNEGRTDQHPHNHKNGTKDDSDKPTRKCEDGGHQPPESFEWPHDP
jgi:hypothetical protein